MEAVAHGSIRKPGLSAHKAAEYVQGQHPKGLPEHVPGTKRKRKRRPQNKRSRLERRVSRKLKKVFK